MTTFFPLLNSLRWHQGSLERNSRKGSNRIGWMGKDGLPIGPKSLVAPSDPSDRLPSRKVVAGRKPPKGNAAAPIRSIFALPSLTGVARAAAPGP